MIDFERIYLVLLLMGIKPVSLFIQINFFLLQFSFGILGFSEEFLHIFYRVLALRIEIQYFDGLLETDESAFMSNSIFSYLFPTFVGDFLFEGSQFLFLQKFFNPQLPISFLFVFEGKARSKELIEIFMLKFVNSHLLLFNFYWLESLLVKY